MTYAHRMQHLDRKPEAQGGKNHSITRQMPLADSGKKEAQGRCGPHMQIERISPGQATKLAMEFINEITQGWEAERASGFRVAVGATIKDLERDPDVQLLMIRALANVWQGTKNADAANSLCHAVRAYRDNYHHLYGLAKMASTAHFSTLGDTAGFFDALVDAKKEIMELTRKMSCEDFSNVLLTAAATTYLEADIRGALVSGLRKRVPTTSAWRA